ncbi:MAG TPA: hypothetical protein VMW35_01685 [Myxococcota bacterium]|nr:hypothetical protein [Myxococcota bacterium]
MAAVAESFFGTHLYARERGETSLLDEPGFEVRRAGGSVHTLQMWGRLRPGWSGSLAEGLSANRASLVRGFARKFGAMRWLAEFTLERTPGGSDLLGLDYLELAARPLPSGRRRPIRLSGFKLAPSPKHGGSLLLEIEGEDEVGFLGALLMRLAFLSLFPEELHIDTRDGRALDRLHLVGIGRSQPTAATAEALEAMLEGLVRAR